MQMTPRCEAYESRRTTKTFCAPHDHIFNTNRHTHRRTQEHTDTVIHRHTQTYAVPSRGTETHTDTVLHRTQTYSHNSERTALLCFARRISHMSCPPLASCNHVFIVGQIPATPLGPAFVTVSRCNRAISTAMRATKLTGSRRLIS